MKVRVLKTFRGYRKGQVFGNWSDGMARIFISRGMVEEIKDESAEETAMVEERAERAAVISRKRK
jgi:hypothetical protein